MIKWSEWSQLFLFTKRFLQSRDLVTVLLEALSLWWTFWRMCWDPALLDWWRTTTTFSSSLPVSWITDDKQLLYTYAQFNSIFFSSVPDVMLCVPANVLECHLLSRLWRQEVLSDRRGSSVSSVNIRRCKYSSVFDCEYSLRSESSLLTSCDFSRRCWMDRSCMRQAWERPRWCWSPWLLGPSSSVTEVCATGGPLYAWRTHVLHWRMWRKIIVFNISMQFLHDWRYVE